MKRVRHGNYAVRPVRHLTHHKRPARTLLTGGWRGLGGDGRPKVILIVTALVVGAVVGGWYLFWSQTFRIRAVDVKGASAASEQQIRALIDRRLTERRFLVLPQANIFVFDRSGAVKDIEKNLFLDELKLIQKMPDQLTIDVRERSLRAVLLTDRRFWALDESGLILRELSVREIEALGDLPPDVGSASVPELGAETMEIPPSDDSAATKKTSAAAVVPVADNVNKFPLIIDRSMNNEPAAAPKERHPGDAAFSQAVLSLILQANARLPDLSGARIRWFSVRDSSETVDVTMDGDWFIYLTTVIPFDVQGSRLSLVLKEKIGARKGDLEYIDLRYNERIFFRFRGGQK